MAAAVRNLRITDGELLLLLQALYAAAVREAPRARAWQVFEKVQRQARRWLEFDGEKTGFRLVSRKSTQLAERRAWLWPKQEAEQ